MSGTIQIEDYKGYTIKIEIDDDPQNPREEMDNLGVMACWHCRYTLGDVQPSESSAEYLDCLKERGAEVLPLYLYDHSGITMRTTPFSCPWDSGQVGLISIEPEVIEREWGAVNEETRLKARNCMEQEVKTYDTYLTGGVCGFVITGFDEETEVDSCWGYYDTDTCLEDACGVVDAIKESEA